MPIINNILYICDENYSGNFNIIGVCDSTLKAKEIIEKYHETRFSIITTELIWIGSNDVYSCNVIEKNTKKILYKNFAEINPIELNERLF